MPTLLGSRRHPAARLVASRRPTLAPLAPATMKTPLVLPQEHLPALLLTLNRRGGSRSPFSPAKIPLSFVPKNPPLAALRRFGLHTGTQRAARLRHTTTWLLSRLLWTTRGARRIADRAYAQSIHNLSHPRGRMAAHVVHGYQFGSNSWRSVIRRVAMRNAFECSRFRLFRAAQGPPPVRSTPREWPQDPEGGTFNQASTAPHTPVFSPKTNRVIAWFCDRCGPYRHPISS